MKKKINNNLEDSYASFKLVKKLVKKGFFVTTKIGGISPLYTKKGEPTTYANYGLMYSELGDGYLPRPSLALVQKWIFANYKIAVLPLLMTKDHWDLFILTEGGEPIGKPSINFKAETYEEALEAGIEFVLKHF